MDSFKLERFIEACGKPDSIITGGPEIVQEFGADDYLLYYKNVQISAGHGYILSAKIKSTDFAINGLKIGDNLNKVNSTFSSNFEHSDTINILSSSDDNLKLLLDDNGMIKEMSLWCNVL
ncbi:hypothetical protein K6119_04310 [Paracrocinitomix mangrovi]|uniref:hypothetical protein n=1 Tax=Paracrocinitomix mangrovi TaxID=2862509 RepID=UPI001C8D3F19|nr:hypothetical protein [Paracrocinitomix mangrovi]UKN02737.1 hypothetical protein K6119_04310 [Paracrocinitomix mangrovi]